MTADYLLPTRTSLVYEYTDGQYLPVINLQNGRGYIVRFNYPQYIYLEGASVSFFIPVVEGWNLIGPFDQNVPITQISTVPSEIINSVFYELGQNGYLTSTVLQTGKGYWVKVT